MARVRSSVIWALERAELEAVVRASRTFSDVLRHAGLNHQGGNCRTLKARLQAEGIDFSHIPQGRDSSRGRRLGGKETPLQEILVENSPYQTRHRLKRRLLQAGLLENRCAVCGQEPMWNGQTLVLVLDHVNGRNNDHRIENLRLLCPNCNSQTATFCGRKRRHSNEE